MHNLTNSSDLKCWQTMSWASTITITFAKQCTVSCYCGTKSDPVLNEENVFITSMLSVH